MVICPASVQIVEFVRLAGGDAKICEYVRGALHPIRVVRAMTRARARMPEPRGLPPRGL